MLEHDGRTLVLTAAAAGRRRRDRLDGARRHRARSARTPEVGVRRDRVARAAQPADVDQGLRGAARRRCVAVASASASSSRSSRCRRTGSSISSTTCSTSHASRPGASRSTAAPPTSREVVREVATLMRTRIDDKGQRLDIDMPDELPRGAGRPRADPPGAHQPGDQRAPLHGQGRDVVDRRSGGAAAASRLEVADNGRGMSEEEASHAFDRFYRAAQRRRRRGPASGSADRAVARGAARRHGRPRRHELGARLALHRRCSRRRRRSPTTGASRRARRCAASACSSSTTSPRSRS